MGPCFLQTERGVCKDKIKNSGNVTVMMTRNACCASVGAAWGELCQACGNRQSYCGKGYVPLGHKCVGKTFIKHNPFSSSSGCKKY